MDLPLPGTADFRGHFIAHRRKADGVEQSLAAHLRAVSVLAAAHASKIGLSEAGELVGLLHDLGKYSAAFQQYLKSATGIIDPDADDYVDADALKGKIDHSTAGAQFIWRNLSGQSAPAVFTAQALALCIASHHSGLIDCIGAQGDRFGEGEFGRRMEKSAARTHFDEASAAAESAVTARARQLLDDEQLVTRFSEAAKRIAQANTKFAPALGLQLGLLIRFLFSCLIDADRIDTADFESKHRAALRQSSRYMPWPVLCDRLEAALARFSSGTTVDSLRRQISGHCLSAASRALGIYSLTVPTGGGKTLASLRFALHHARRHQLQRIFYVIPYTSIIDQNAEVTRNILDPDDKDHIVLEHHANLSPERQTWRQKILSENWDAPVVLTTLVQFLDSLFAAGTRGARRMHQLANSVIIFDEVQSLPVKCVHLFNNAVNFLAEQCNCTVILCTATQPLLHKVSEKQGAIRLADEPELVPETQQLFISLERVQISDRSKPGGWTCAEVAEFAAAQLRSHGNCLVILNTKASARVVYELLASLDPAERVHLSTNMCPAHRREKLAYVRNRLAAGAPILCLSTQLIEAGVDVDFNVVIRSLAGIDSIAQAAGRCNRNGRREKGDVYVVNISEENLGRLPEIKIAAACARRVLDDFASTPERYLAGLCGPQALDDYYRYYFFQRKDEMAYTVPAANIGHDDTLLNLLSENSAALAAYSQKAERGPRIAFAQAFATAAGQFETIDMPTRGIVVPFGPEGAQIIADLCAAFEIEKQFELLRRAQQFTVNVFPHVLRALSDAGAVHPVQEDTGILYLLPQYYSNEYGLSIESISGVEFLNA